MLLALALAAVVGAGLWFVSRRHLVSPATHYRAGSRPRWMPASAPQGSCVDWSTMPAAAWAATVGPTVGTVAAMLAAEDEVCSAVRGLRAALDPLPAVMHAAAVVYYGHRLLGASITPGRAVAAAATCYFCDGDPALLAGSEPHLWELELPAAVAPYLARARAELLVLPTAHPDGQHGALSPADSRPPAAPRRT
jgi:hypothetical protein